MEDFICILSIENEMCYKLTGTLSIPFTLTAILFKLLNTLFCNIGMLQWESMKKGTSERMKIGDKKKPFFTKKEVRNL